MPILDPNQVGFNAGGGFSYQGTRIDKVGGVVAENTLVAIVIDRSSSVDSFADKLEACVQEIMTSCLQSGRNQQLQVRMLVFGSDVSEFHGYRMLSTLKATDYQNFLNCGGMTALNDATINAAKSTLDYAHNLSASDVTTNGIMFVLTDGQENNSTHRNISDVAAAIMAAKSDPTERLESFLTVLIGVNTGGGGVSSYLQDYKDQAGFDEYIDIAKADKDSLAKLADFVSHSITSQSQSVGSGSAGTLASVPTF